MDGGSAAYFRRKEKQRDSTGANTLQASAMGSRVVSTKATMDHMKLRTTHQVKYPCMYVSSKPDNATSKDNAQEDDKVRRILVQQPVLNGSTPNPDQILLPRGACTRTSTTVSKRVIPCQPTGRNIQITIWGI